MIRKLFVITPEFPPASGGCARSSYELATGLVREGQKCDVIVVNESFKPDSKFTKDLNLSVISANPRKVIHILRIIINLRKLVSEDDVIHVYNVFLTPIVSLACFGKKVKIFATLNNYNWGCLNPIYYAQNSCKVCTISSRMNCSNYKKNIIFTLITPILNNVSGFFTFTNEMEKIYRLNGRKRKFFRVQNFLDKDLKIAHLDKVKLKNNAKKKNRIAYIGSLDDRKGIDLFLQTSTRIIGDTDIFVCTTDDYRNYEKEYPNVIFKKFSVSNKAEYKDFLTNLDLLVHPCRWNEPFARVWIEASAYGCAILTSRLTGHSEILGDAAAYFDNDSANDLTCKINDLMMNSNRLEAYKIRSFEWYSNLKSNDDIVATIVDSYWYND